VVGTENPLPALRPVQVPWPAGAVLVLWTDGLKSAVSMEGCSDFIHHDAALVAATLHRDFSRGSDDAGIVVVRRRG
jgi:hypothetical protein